MVKIIENETLYKLTPTGLRQWKIALTTDSEPPTHFTVTVEYGQIDSKQQTNFDLFSTQQQALQHFQRKLNHKLDREGYTPHIPHNLPDLPMLASTYNPKILPSKVYFQPKLDGIRCIASNSGLKSRKDLPLTALPHIETFLKHLPPEITLDGELYCHGLNFQQHLSLIKRDQPLPDHEKIYYNVFDVVDFNLTYQERLSLLTDLFFSFPKSSPITFVPTSSLSPASDLPTYHKQYIELGYEGTIIRTPTHLYVPNSRSRGLQKYKEFDEVICEIVDITAAEKGREAYAAIFICTGVFRGHQVTFKARPKMNIHTRKFIHTNKDDFIGQYTRIRYKNLSSDHTPLQPVAEGLSKTPNM